MSDLDLWKSEGEGMLSLEDGDLRLLVQQKPGWALFLVRQYSTDRPAHPLAIVTSGVRDNVREAMAGAEKAAAWLTTPMGAGGHVACDTAATGLHVS